MEKRFEELLEMMLRCRATDVHFTIDENSVRIKLRGINGLIDMKATDSDRQLFNYLQYQAHLDITSANKPQSGSFRYYYEGSFYDFRFAVLTTRYYRNGVLRILNCNNGMSLEELTFDRQAKTVLKSWMNERSGLILFTGLTGSGKTTTMYTLLREVRGRTIYSIEDPIEVVMDGMIQLQVNDKIGFDYDEGIKQILRHNPDIIMIGEIRDEKAARMAVRAALTGCLVLSSLHARSTNSAINRLLELGVNRNDLEDCLLGIVNQRLFRKKDNDSYTCIYDILSGTRLEECLKERNSSHEHMEWKIARARQLNIIE